MNEICRYLFPHLTPWLDTAVIYDLVDVLTSILHIFENRKYILLGLLKSIFVQVNISVFYFLVKPDFGHVLSKC